MAKTKKATRKGKGTSKRTAKTGTPRKGRKPRKARKPGATRGVAAAAPFECLDRPDAESLVMRCLGLELDVSTRLGDCFPNATRRDQFCQLVADESGAPRTRVPCGSGTTLDEVIGAISC